MVWEIIISDTAFTFCV